MSDPHTLYINQNRLVQACAQDPSLNDMMLSKFGDDWKFFACAKKNINVARSWYPRFGSNLLDLPPQRLISADMHLRDLLRTDSNSFAEITDQRFWQLRQTHNDKPWLICWSGGIDSTVIVTSILKNTSVNQRQDYVIYCNPSSVWEAPRFFQEHILTNFDLVDSTSYQIHGHVKNHYVIDGEPADCVWGYLRPFLHKIDDMQQSWKKNPDPLIELCTELLGDAAAAKWFFARIADNIKSQDCPVETYLQWSCWINFNYQYFDAVSRLLWFQNCTTDISHVQRSIINWYDCQPYNAWGLGNMLQHSRDAEQQIYKIHAKEYVKEIFNDDHWYYLKHKQASGGAKKEHRWTAVSRDYEFCTDIKGAMADVLAWPHH